MQKHFADRYFFCFAGLHLPGSLQKTFSKRFSEFLDNCHWYQSFIFCVLQTKQYCMFYTPLCPPGDFSPDGRRLRGVLPRLFSFVEPHGSWRIISIQPWHPPLPMLPSFFRLHLWQRLLLLPWARIQPTPLLRPVPDR